MKLKRSKFPRKFDKIKSRELNPLKITNLGGSIQIHEGFSQSYFKREKKSLTG